MLGVGGEWFNRFTRAPLRLEDFEKEHVTSSEVTQAIQKILEAKPGLFGDLSVGEQAVFEKNISVAEQISGSDDSVIKIKQLVSSVLQSQKEALARDLPKAYKDPLPFLQNLKAYGSIDQTVLVEIVKVAAVTYKVSLWIQNYGIKDQSALIEIAKISASLEGFELSENIQNYGITDPAALIEIAKIAAARYGGSVSFDIKKYDIKNPTALIEIAKIAAASDGGAVSQYIQEYEIADKEALIEIAKIAAAQNGYYVSVYIKNYGITNKEALIEIAKIATVQDGVRVSYQIQKYDITDQAVLVEMAKIAAEQDGEVVCLNIQNYGITDKMALMEIAKIAVKQNPSAVLKHLDSFELDKSTNEYKNLITRGLLFGFAVKGNEFANEIASLPVLAPFLEGDSPVSFYIQANKKEILPDNLWNERDRNQILDKVADYRNVGIGAYLAASLLEKAGSVEYRKAYQSLAFEKVKGVKEATFMTQRVLPSILPAKWLVEAKTEALVTTEEEKAIADVLLVGLKKSKDEFKNNYSPLMQTYLLATLALDKAEGLSSTRKLQILSRICCFPEKVKGLGLIRSFCVRQEIEALNNFPLKDPIYEFTQAFEEALLSERFIDLSDIENLSDKYLNKFGNTRMPMALETYMTGLRSLGDERVRNSLERFIKSVLQGTFKSERYDTDKSPHLKTIQEYDKRNGTDVLVQWQNLTLEVPIVPVTRSSGAATISFESFFQEKLGDGHWVKEGVDNFPELTAFLKANAETRKTILEGNALSQPQKLCMELISGSTLPKEEQIQKIDSIRTHLATLKLELDHDLGGLANSLRSTKSISFLEKVELCKGWEDLFLAGSEVADSCQRIDGDKDRNKCLLAYCLDGKNAMIAVKGAGGKLLARSMLRLLWDKTDAKPVLFLDRLYPRRCPEDRESAIKEAASKCSSELGLELFTDWDTGSPSTGKVIESLGSSCSYEYADGAEGVMLNGVYTIKQPRQINIV